MTHSVLEREVYGLVMGRMSINNPTTQRVPTREDFTPMSQNLNETYEEGNFV
jgi:hypothetical protein